MLLSAFLGVPYKFEVQQMLEEPQWGLVFEKTRWIIEKYRLSHRYVLWFEMVAYLQHFSLNYVLEKTQVKCKIVMYDIRDSLLQNWLVYSTCFITLFSCFYNSSVPMDKIFRRDSDLTCLQKVSCLHFNWLLCLRILKLFISMCFPMMPNALWIHFLFLLLLFFLFKINF